MSEFDRLKDYIIKFSGLCKGMIGAGNLGMSYTSTTENYEKESLEILAGIEKETNALKEELLSKQKKRKTKKT